MAFHPHQPENLVHAGENGEFFGLYPFKSPRLQHLGNVALYGTPVIGKFDEGIEFRTPEIFPDFARFVSQLHIEAVGEGVGGVGTQN